MAQLLWEHVTWTGRRHSEGQDEVPENQHLAHTRIPMVTLAIQDTYAASLDRIQRRMISALMQIKPAPHEGLDAFVKRRHIISGKVATKSGRWSHMWAQSIGKWNDHVQRKHDPKTWSAPLLEWHGPEWLQLQRLIASSSTQESRTNTRVYRGKVHRRWSEGLSKAVTMPDPRC